MIVITGRNTGSRHRLVKWSNFGPWFNIDDVPWNYWIIPDTVPEVLKKYFRKTNDTWLESVWNIVSQIQEPTASKLIYFYYQNIFLDFEKIAPHELA